MGVSEVERRKGEDLKPEPQGASARVGSSQIESPASLIDARFDHDSCGVGFVASALGKADHKILQDALTALSRLAHRGAVAADGASSDGIGLMSGVPRELLLSATGVELQDSALLGVGMLFLPPEETRAKSVMESCLASQGLGILAWRDVPTRPEVLGEIALSTMPKIRQVVVADGATGDAAGSLGRGAFFGR